VTQHWCCLVAFTDKFKFSIRIGIFQFPSGNLGYVI
jgi:hypothetical protein